MIELEKALIDRCETEPQYKTLLAQWTFDKQLLSRALQSVSLTFPHYSMHDGSHADTILLEIARVLGQHRINQLSPTDLWLLLEVAYQHDLGMIVPDETMRRWWSDPKFEDFLERLTDHTDDQIRQAASLLDKRKTFKPEGNAWPFDVRRALVLIMAEYARSSHAARSREYVAVPSLINLDSPRTPLVPRRFWELIGQICENHGQNFSETMKLPRCESGFSTDVAHPRFIACMLRLGDLLDLDDGRFCPVLARTFGGLPPSSKAHKEKHHSIESFFVGPSEIRVVAECSTSESFDVTEHWFAMLRSELREQSFHWAEISPQLDFGTIPAAGRIEPRLRGYYTFPDGRRPRFDVDKWTMLSFVRGSELYADETAFIEELLQNAVDATLLRLWLSNPKKWRSLDQTKSVNALEELRANLTKFPISVSVKKTKREAGHNHWRVIVRDHGTGISRSDIEYIQTVGSSKKNPRRREAMRGMPDWMQPSGYFGLGLQSVFLFSDKIILRSRPNDSTETLEIEFTLSPGRKEPEILVKPITGKKAFSKPGTMVQFLLHEPPVPLKYGYNLEFEETRNVSRGYDPLLNDELPILPSKIRDTTRAFARSTLGHIKLGTNTTRFYSKKHTDRELFFDATSGIEFSLQAGVGRTGFEFFFRGRATSQRFRNMFFYGSVNWNHGNASEILTIDRKKVQSRALERIEHEIDHALLQILPRYYDSVLNGGNDRLKERQWLSLAAEVVEHIRDAKVIPSDKTWKEIVYSASDTDGMSNPAITLGDIVACDTIQFTQTPTWLGRPIMGRTPMAKRTDDTKLHLISSHFEQWFWELFRNWQFTLQKSILTSERSQSWEHQWTAHRIASGGIDIIEDDTVLKSIFQQASAKHNERIRRTIPCPNRYRALALSDDSGSNPGYVSQIHAELSPRALFPFRVDQDGFISTEGVNELIEWTYNHRANSTTTMRDIAQAALNLIEDAHQIFKEDWKERAHYNISEVRRQLIDKYKIVT